MGPPAPSVQGSSAHSGTYRLSGAHLSIELYGRDDVVPMLEFQRLIIQHVRSGFRPLQPLARGTALPLPDFQVALPRPLLTSQNPPLMSPLPVADDEVHPSEVSATQSACGF